MSAELTNAQRKMLLSMLDGHIKPVERLRSAATKRALHRRGMIQMVFAGESRLVAGYRITDAGREALEGNDG